MRPIFGGARTSNTPSNELRWRHAGAEAQVRKGRFVIDESTDLPEGTEVELQLVKGTDAFADMARGDREELEEAIEEGFLDFENGDHIGAREFLAQLRAKDA